MCRQFYYAILIFQVDECISNAPLKETPNDLDKVRNQNI